MAAFSDQDVFTAAPDLALADLGGEAVLLDPGSGQYFGLNDVATQIFNLISEPKTLVEVVDALAAEYEADREQLRGDAVAFLGELVHRNLVARLPAGGA